MKLNLKEIYNNIRDKDILIIWVVAVCLLLLLIVVSVFLPGQTKNPNTSQPEYNLSKDQFDNSNTSILLSADQTVDFTSQNLPTENPIYKTSIPDVSTNLVTWLANNGRTGAGFNCDDVFCAWKSSDGKEVLEYSKITGVLSFTLNLPDKISIEKSKESESVSELASKLVKDMTGRELVFSDAFRSNYVSNAYTDGQYTYYLYRKENDTYIWGEFEKATGNYLNFTKNGNAFGATFQVLDLIQTDATPVKLLPISKISVNSASLPMIYYPDQYSLTKIVERSQAGTTIKQNNDVEFAAGSAQAKSCQYREIKLGSKYVTTDDGVGVFVPMYKLGCSYIYNLKNSNYDVPGDLLITAY